MFGAVNIQQSIMNNSLKLNGNIIDNDENRVLFSRHNAKLQKLFNNSTCR